MTVVVFVSPSLPPWCLVVFLGTAWTMLVEWNNLGCGLCCSFTLLQVQPAQRRCVGKGKERHLWAAPVLYFGLVYLLFLFFFSMSVQTKFQRGFLNWRFVRIWEGDYLFDGFAWIRCFMTVSERTVDGTFLEGNGSLVCAILRQPESRGVLHSVLAALGLGAHTFVAGGGTFVASALLASPSVQVSCACICL